MAKMTMDELQSKVWNLPSGDEYAVQVLNDTKEWSHINYYDIKDFQKARAIFSGGDKGTRMVKISRYIALEDTISVHSVLFSK